MTKIQLPLFDDKTILPTGKYHISFSEYSVHKDCSFRHKLQYIDKLAPFEGSIFTSYGKAIHDAIENYLKTRKMATSEEVKKYFFELMDPLTITLSPDEHEKLLKQCNEFALHIEDTIKQIPSWIDTTFPGWKIHSAEFNLFENIEKQTNIHFKGYIDAILMVPKKERKNSKKKVLRLSDYSESSDSQEKIEYEYYIIDWKSCQFFWTSDKRRDFKTQMQLILYKHYFCTKFNIPLKDVKCGFGLIRMKTNKNNSDRCQFVSVSAGEKTITRALHEINLMINTLKKKMYMKNRSSCKYCPFYKTTSCP